MKTEDIKKLSDEELNLELINQRRHLYDLRSQAVTEKLENPSMIKNTKRDIARILTEKRQRELQAKHV